MRVTITPNNVVTLCDLRGSCGEFGVIIQRPGGGPAAEYFFGVSSSREELYSAAQEFLDQLQNNHYTSSGMQVADPKRKFETFVFSPCADALYAIFVNGTPLGNSPDDIYCDVQVFAIGRNARHNSSGLLMADL